jgi:hypothetical protein
VIAIVGVHAASGNDDSILRRTRAGPDVVVAVAVDVGPTVVSAASNDVHFVIVIGPVLRLVQHAGRGMEHQTLRIPVAIRPRGVAERISRCRFPVERQSKNLPAE